MSSITERVMTTAYWVQGTYCCVQMCDQFAQFIDNKESLKLRLIQCLQSILSQIKDSSIICAQGISYYKESFLLWI